MTHAAMLKGLLAQKKGTPANRDAVAKQRLAMIALSKQLREQQVAAAKEAAKTAAVADVVADVVVKDLSVGESVG